MAFPIRPFSYLVESLGDLLLVHQDFEDFTTCKDFLIRGKPYVGHSTYNYFNVYKLDFASKVWERVESLHGRALFSAHHRSAMSLSTSDFPELEENSIYFTNELSEMHRFYILLGVVETKVFKSYYINSEGIVVKNIHHVLFWIVPDPWWGIAKQQLSSYCVSFHY